MLRQAFLTDIADHPADAVPRRVYADWLEEHGQAHRAEFIRLQLQRASLAPDDPAGEPLLARERQLLAEHDVAWRGELPQIDGIEWGEFHGGFVEEAIAQSPEAFLNQSEAIFRAAPVRRLRLRQQGATGWGQRLGTATATQRLCELNLSNVSIWFREIRSLLQEGVSLQGLEGLYLAYLKKEQPDETEYPFLLKSRHLWRVRTLSLAGASTHQCSGILFSEEYPSLEHLDLRDIPLGVDYGPNFGHFCQGIPSPQIHTLQLTHCGLWEEAMASLVTASRLQRLRVLYLNHNPIGDEGVRLLARHPLPELRDLDLRQTHLTDDAVTHLLDSPLAESLRRVWLGGNSFGRASWEALRACFGTRLCG
jgi:uncharacterized protein (TIGR02996 family)